jgi:hypothetical protein
MYSVFSLLSLPGKRKAYPSSKKPVLGSDVELFVDRPNTSQRNSYTFGHSPSTHDIRLRVEHLDLEHEILIRESILYQRPLSESKISQTIKMLLKHTSIPPGFQPLIR